MGGAQALARPAEFLAHQVQRIARRDPEFGVKGVGEIRQRAFERHEKVGRDARHLRPRRRGLDIEPAPQPVLFLEATGHQLRVTQLLRLELRLDLECEGGGSDAEADGTPGVRRRPVEARREAVEAEALTNVEAGPELARSPGGALMRAVWPSPTRAPWIKPFAIHCDTRAGETPRSLAKWLLRISCGSTLRACFLDPF